MAQDFYLDFNVRGSERKRLVNAIADYMQCDAEYLRAPTFAYTVDYFTISKDGVVSFDSRADSDEIEGLIDALSEQGFVCFTSNRSLPDDEISDDRSKSSIKHKADTVYLEMPADSVSMENLVKILEAKGALIKKALGVEKLPIAEHKEIVEFDWFSGATSTDELQARVHLITALCDMSKKQKRITATEKTVGSEKYAFRCFLLRLGFIGEKYKTERKILLKNLTGDSSHK